MSKKKANKVFEVTGADETVIVLARHAKGARTVAKEHIDGVTLMSSVEELPVALKSRAVDRKIHAPS